MPHTRRPDFFFFSPAASARTSSAEDDGTRFSAGEPEHGARARPEVEPPKAAPVGRLPSAYGLSFFFATFSFTYFTNAPSVIRFSFFMPRMRTFSVLRLFSLSPITSMYGIFIFSDLRIL